MKPNPKPVTILANHRACRQWTNQTSKQLHVAEKKPAKTCVNQSVLLLADREMGEFFFSHLLSIERTNQNNTNYMYLRHKIKLSLTKLKVTLIFVTHKISEVCIKWGSWNIFYYYKQTKLLAGIGKMKIWLAEALSLTVINRCMLQVRNVFFGLLVLTNNIKATGPANDQITWWEIQQLPREYKQWIVKTDLNRSYCFFTLFYSFLLFCLQ